MRYVRIPFGAEISKDGMETKLFCEMLSKFPEDSKVLGFGHDNLGRIDYVFISSSQFEEVPHGSYPPDVSPYFHKSPDGTVTCDGVGFNQIKLECPHDWKEYFGVGLYPSYNYCTKCGVKQ